MPSAKPLSEYAKQYTRRNEAIAATYAAAGYTLKEIGEYFGLNYSRIIRIARDTSEAKRKT